MKAAKILERLGFGKARISNELVVTEQQRVSLKTVTTARSDFTAIPVYAPKVEVTLVPKKPENITDAELRQALATIAQEDAAAVKEAEDFQRLMAHWQRHARANDVKEWVRSEQASNSSSPRQDNFAGPELEFYARTTEALPDASPVLVLGNTYEAQRLPFSEVFALDAPSNKNNG